MPILPQRRAAAARLRLSLRADQSERAGERAKKRKSKPAIFVHDEILS